MFTGAPGGFSRITGFTDTGLRVAGDVWVRGFAGGGAGASALGAGAGVNSDHFCPRILHSTGKI